LQSFIRPPPVFNKVCATTTTTNSKGEKKTCNNKSLHDTQGDKEKNEGQNGLKKGSKGKKKP
jgi:hypothetical protein